MKIMSFFILLNLVFSSITACGSLEIKTKVTTSEKKSNLASKKTSSNINNKKNDNDNDNDKNTQCNLKLSSKDGHSIGLPPSKTKMGHTIIFDYKRIKDDKGDYTFYFDCELELGSKTAIDTFEKALVDRIPGKEFMITIDATFKPGIDSPPPVWITYKVKIKKIIKW